jgi:hypothetical protein
MPEEIYFDIEKSTYAKTWNELSERQVLQVIHILHSKKVLGWKIVHLANTICKIGKREELNIVEKDLIKITTFLLDGKVELTQNPLPKLKTGFWSALYGPTDKLNTSTFGEFIMADSFCQNHIEEEDLIKKEEWLCKMIACLFRPKKKNHNPASSTYDGDIRERFNSWNLDSRLPKVRRLDFETKQAILAYFISCKNYFAEVYTDIFTKGESSGEGGNWFTTLHHISDKVTDYEPITETRVALALFDLNEKQKTAKKNKAEMEKLKR